MLLCVWELSKFECENSGEMDPKSSKEISNNDLKCALGPTMAQRKVSEKENKLCTSKAQVCWGGGSLEVWCHTDKPTETAQPGVLLSRLELLQLLGPSWEVWDLVVDGQVLQRPQLVFYWVQGFCPSMNLAKANSCSDGSDDQKRLQSHQNTRRVDLEFPNQPGNVFHVGQCIQGAGWL